MKDKIKKVLTFIGFTVVIVAAIMSVFEGFEAMSIALYLPAIFALCFIFAETKTLNNFGYAFSAFNFALGLFYVGWEDTMILGIGLIIMGLATVFYFIELVFGFFGYVINKTKGASVSAVATDDFSEVEKYSQMLADGIITESEFASLKAKIFAVDKKKVSSFEDLKKWKKLFDKALISEEEYSSIKHKILK